MPTGQLLGTGDDATTQFQLLKHYPSGSVIEVRTITILLKNSEVAAGLF
jgi:hypothetical protein